LSFYSSYDTGQTWNFISAFPIPNNLHPDSGNTNFTTSQDGKIIYAGMRLLYKSTELYAECVIYVSKDSGLSWTPINMYGYTDVFYNEPRPVLSCNIYGDILFVPDSSSFITSTPQLITYYPTRPDFAVCNFPQDISFNSLMNLACYNSGNNIFLYTAVDNYPRTNQTVSTYSVVNKYNPGHIPCFKYDSKILCLKEDREVYVKVQDIKKGDLVKTLKNGYLPVDMIGKRTFSHNFSTNRNKEQLYKCSRTEYPELFEDLIITGTHSILVDNFKNQEQKDKTIEILGKIYVTDNKYRLPVCADPRASVYEKSGSYKIYHLALENENYYMNYGIYANGLLVETCSKRYLKELSNMTLIE
jgi:hypothetical protein